MISFASSDSVAGLHKLQHLVRFYDFIRSIHAMTKMPQNLRIGNKFKKLNTIDPCMWLTYTNTNEIRYTTYFVLYYPCTKTQLEI